MGGHARHCNVTTEQRFWAKVDKSAGPDVCWPWNGARVPAGGYGRFLADRLIAAHRYCWILHFGPIESSEIDVMHICDNPPCCNPKHLRAVTTRENMEDAYRKRRHAFGERCPRRKLSEAQAKYIISQRGKRTAKDLASEFGVTATHVSQIWCGRMWKHLASHSLSTV